MKMHTAYPRAINRKVFLRSEGKVWGSKAVLNMCGLFGNSFLLEDRGQALQSYAWEDPNSPIPQTLNPKPLTLKKLNPTA